MPSKAARKLVAKGTELHLELIVHHKDFFRPTPKETYGLDDAHPRQIHECVRFQKMHFLLPKLGLRDIPFELRTPLQLGPDAHRFQKKPSDIVPMIVIFPPIIPQKHAQSDHVVLFLSGNPSKFPLNFIIVCLPDPGP